MEIKGICLVHICIILFINLQYNSVSAITSSNFLQDPRRKRCIERGSEITCSYIPKDIPAGTQTVRLRNISSIDFPDGTLRKGLFSTHNWGQVKKLELSADSVWLDTHETFQVFNSSCFYGLHNLETLRISLSNSIDFTPLTLNGLNQLKMLDLSGCPRFYLDNLINSLNQNGLVPNLQSLNISGINIFRDGLQLTEQFFQVIYDKRIKELDLSSTQILFVNVTSFLKYCHILEYLNLSRVRFSYFTGRPINQICQNLRYVDASYISLPSSMMPDKGSISVDRDIVLPIDLKWTFTKSFLNVEYINLSGLTRLRTRYSYENITLHLLGASALKLKVLILRDNFFDRLDVKLLPKIGSLKKLDLSACSIRYLHPDFISSFVSLIWIDLSLNQLNSMMKENATLFGQLFYNLSLLRYIGLAGNDLLFLPCEMFEFNIKIETLDLSNNRLSKLPFGIRNLKKLKFLNLKANMIKDIDSALLLSLDGLSLILKENPIACSRCDSLHFIQWLTTSESTEKYLSGMTCVNENSEHVNIGKEVIDNLREICNRTKVIIISSVASAFAVIAFVTVLLAIRRYRQQRRYRLEMEDRIALIRQGAEPYRFAVFLSYSSNDDDFINNYVYQPLNEHLQYAIGEDRDLVCEGDRNFQLGRSIPEQISVLLKRSSVVVVLLTDSYSLSVHCRNEFEQAFMLEKPIVLMVKDKLNPDLMTPLIRDIYETRTRILWRSENGQYVLKTSWENVCTSIIELVDNKRRGRRT